MDVLDKIKEFNKMHYRPPLEVTNVDSVHDLDEIKLRELRECFNLFDLNNDGFICANDLKGTYMTMGQMDVADEDIAKMLEDSSNPMNFDAFAMMMCFKTMAMEPEIVLLEALSKWDEKCQGVISMERLYTHLITYNKDRLTVEEAKAALAEAPIVDKPGLQGLESAEDSFIDYPAWIEKFAGFRKPTTTRSFN
ncbi:unnamed protein product [Diamesa hyperborea]